MNCESAWTRREAKQLQYNSVQLQAQLKSHDTGNIANINYWSMHYNRTTYCW